MTAQIQTGSAKPESTVCDGTVISNHDTCNDTRQKQHSFVHDWNGNTADLAFIDETADHFLIRNQMRNGVNKPETGDTNIDMSIVDRENCSRFEPHTLWEMRHNDS